MGNEVIYNLLLFAIGNPEDVTGFKINDMCGITSAIMKFKLINALNGVLSKIGNLSNLSIGVCADGKKVSGILIEFFGNPMSWCLE